MPLEFFTDQVQIRGPRADKSYSVTFIVPEVELINITPLILAHSAYLKVTVSDAESQPTYANQEEQTSFE